MANPEEKERKKGEKHIHINIFLFTHPVNRCERK